MSLLRQVGQEMCPLFNLRLNLVTGAVTNHVCKQDGRIPARVSHGGYSSYIFERSSIVADRIFFLATRDSPPIRLVTSSSV